MTLSTCILKEVTKVDDTFVILLEDLVKIWPENRQELMRATTLGSIQDGELGVFLITLDGMPVGITGYFMPEFEDEFFKDDEVGLRWHGLLPQWQNYGISHRALWALVDVIRWRHPEKRFLSEIAPNDLTHPIVKHFLDNDFTVGESITNYSPAKNLSNFIGIYDACT